MFIKSHALSPASLILSESCLSADFLAAESLLVLDGLGKSVIPEILRLWSKVTAFRQWKKCSMFHWLLDVTSNSWIFKRLRDVR